MLRLRGRLTGFAAGAFGALAGRYWARHHHRAAGSLEAPMWACLAGLRRASGGGSFALAHLYGPWFLHRRERCDRLLRQALWLSFRLPEMTGMPPAQPHSLGRVRRTDTADECVLPHGCLPSGPPQGSQDRKRHRSNTSSLGATTLGRRRSRWLISCTTRHLRHWGLLDATLSLGPRCP